MIREIVIYPNKILKKKSKPVKNFNSDLHTLLDDMYDTMISKSGIGLAAIQIGVDKRVLIINLPREENDEEIQYKEDLLEIINPVIISKNGEEIYKEGCLSVPEFYEEVKRAKEIEIEYFDRYGNKQNLKADSLLAIAIQHEIDHLDGYLFVERLPLLKRKKFEKEWKKKKRRNTHNLYKNNKQE